MGCGILVGYFSKQDDARKAVGKLARLGFSRTALVHKGSDGIVHVVDLFLWTRILVVTVAACLSGCIGGVAGLFLHWPQPFSPSSSLTSILVSATIGATATLLWLRRSRHGVEPGVLRDHARWLVSGESVLILQATVDSLQRPVALLRDSGDSPPALFVMHPKRERRHEMRRQTVKLSPLQILEHARRHAG